MYTYVYVHYCNFDTLQMCTKFLLGEKGIFGFSIKSETIQTSFCLSKTSQLLYRSIDNSISYIIKSRKINFRDKKIPPKSLKYHPRKLVFL